MAFASRQDAGYRLGVCLRDHRLHADLVAGLPRGGVIVAAEVARILMLPLDAIVVRKIGHPRQREFALGALAEGGVVVLDPTQIRTLSVARSELDAVVAEETARLHHYERLFHGDAILPLEGRTVIIVDDGLATGATAEAAVKSAKARGASRVIAAAPVASASAIERLARVADETYVLIQDRAFEAVGQYYRHFPQTSDEEVVALLHEPRP
jgi:predicted phosphoribosyltransferase